jgi:hypothetical protein
MDPNLMRALANERHAHYLADADIARRAGMVPERAGEETRVEHVVHGMLHVLHHDGRHGGHVLPR